MSFVQRETLPRHYRVVVQDDSILLCQLEGAISNDELEDYLREVDTVHAQRKLHAVIIDARSATRMNSVQRARMGAWLRETEQSRLPVVASVAFVVSSPLVRGAMTAIHWFSPPPMPMLFTGDIEEAHRWSLEQLAKRET